MSRNRKVTSVGLELDIEKKAKKQAWEQHKNFSTFVNDALREKLGLQK